MPGRGITRKVELEQPHERLLACGWVHAHSLNDRLEYRVVCESGTAYRINMTVHGQVAATPCAGTMPLRP